MLEEEELLLEPLPDVVGSTGPPVEEKPLELDEAAELEPDSVATPSSGGQAQIRKGSRKSFRMMGGAYLRTAPWKTKRTRWMAKAPWELTLRKGYWTPPPSICAMGSFLPKI